MTSFLRTACALLALYGTLAAVCVLPAVFYPC